MAPEKYFITAAGDCYVLPNYLVITDHSDPKEILRRKDSDSIPLFRFGLLALAIGLIFYVVYQFNLGIKDPIFTMLPAAIFCLYVYFRWRSRSNIAVLERSGIRNIQLKKIMFTPTFVVLFKNKKGKFRERLIVMKSNESQHLSEALNILRTERLMSDKSINTSLNTESAKKVQSTQEPKTKTTPENKSKPEEKVPSTTFKRNSDGYMKDY